MDKNFSPSYSSSQITYAEAEAVEFSRFRFHRKRTASSFRFHIPALNCVPIRSYKIYVVAPHSRAYTSNSNKNF